MQEKEEERKKKMPKEKKRRRRKKEEEEGERERIQVECVGLDKWNNNKKSEKILFK